MPYSEKMISFMQKLRNDEELNRLKQEYRDLTGETAYGFNYDEYSSIEDYKQSYRDRIAQLKKDNK